MSVTHVSFPRDDHAPHDSQSDSTLDSNPISPSNPIQSSLSVDTEDVSTSGHRRMARAEATERTGLLIDVYDEENGRYYSTTTSSPVSRRPSRINTRADNMGICKYQSRRPSYPGDTPSPAFLRSGLRTPKWNRSQILDSKILNERLWYDQFTSTDWVHDTIADGYRALALRKHKNLRGRLNLLFDAAQGWILVALIGCLTAAVAYLIDISEAALFDLKRGYCRKGWYLNQSRCCGHQTDCKMWQTWSEILTIGEPKSLILDYIGFITGVVGFAMIACLLTLRSKTVIPSNIALTLDEDFGARCAKESVQSLDTASSPAADSVTVRPVMTYYSAAGSGVAEVKVILSGFVLHGYLGLKTLVLKCPALVLSVASGMSLGKEGPYVHIATCIGNIACRIFSKYNLNDAKRREVMSAAAASGVAVAFGSPLGGVLFSLEEVSYYFPPKTLFRTFFCCIVAALSLKFLNPYGTNKIVFFEVRYVSDWHVFEMFNFAFLGIIGGLAGALFIKASRIWATSFRQLKVIKQNPLFEVFLVALITGLLSFWNRYANLSVTELLFELASPCGPNNNTGLCPKTRDDIPRIVGYLSVAFVIKALLTTITFGIKVPAGIYVPSMVCGGLIGRIVGHLVQYVVLSSPESWVFGHCSASADAESCITPGLYALVAAGATMCGVTRLSVTLAVILFELTGSLDHVLPFSIGVLTAKWTADYVEPYSIYDLLIDMNSYPFMDNKHMPLFDTDTELGDITPRLRIQHIIDLSISPYVRANELRAKLDILQIAGELDGGIAIIRDKALVGVIPAPDLEFALDRLETSEDETLCLMSDTDQFARSSGRRRWFPDVGHEDEASDSMDDSTSGRQSVNDQDRTKPFEADFVHYVDPAPVSLEVHSSMNLVYQCFSKLGLRYLCVVEAGEYRGMVHKKAFVRYLKTFNTKHE